MTENELQQAVNLREREQDIAATKQNSYIMRFVNIVYFVFGAIELLLLLRLTLHLIGANSDNAFASFIDGASAPFVALFTTLLHNPTINESSVLEATTLIAMVVWAIVAWLVGQVIWLVLSRPR